MSANVVFFRGYYAVYENFSEECLILKVEPIDHEMDLNSVIFVNSQFEDIAGIAYTFFYTENQLIIPFSSIDFIINIDLITSLQSNPGAQKPKKDGIKFKNNNIST
jgi:hypothetical protein